MSLADRPSKRKMSHRYEPARRCIYCGAFRYSAEEPLRALADEHVIPYALAKDALVLPEASCRACERLTGRFEQIVLRGAFGLYRAAYPDAPNRKRKKFISVKLPAGQRGGLILPARQIRAPIGKVPPGLVMYHFYAPSRPQGIPGVRELRGTYWAIAGKDETREFVEKYGPFFIGTLNELAFARTIAKIAHAFAIATYGLGSFKPLLLDFILGRTDIYNDLVGGEFDIPTATPPTHVFHLEEATGCFHGENLLAVKLRLFPQHGTPQYFIIVGSFDDSGLPTPRPCGLVPLDPPPGWNP